MSTFCTGRRTLDPKNDVVFKMLFAAERNRDLLIALLTAVLAPPSPIESAEVLNPDIDRKDWDDKGNPTHELEGRAVLNWCQFLSARTDQELETLAMTDPNIERAKQALDDLSADPKARELARDREIWHYFYDRGLQLAERGGREKGIAEGLATAVRTVCELLGIELTAAREARLAKASTAQLEELLDSLKRDRRWPE